MKFPRKLRVDLIAAAIFLSGLTTYSFAQPGQYYNSADLQVAVKKLNVLGSVLYLAAHPDDENTGVISYFSKGRKYRTAYLSLTRGDGGQNLIGSEKGDQIGIIRTQELLAARRVDGAEQYFTRAIDFGYSKTMEETNRFWGKDNILADMVWVIRKYQPDIIVTRFPPGGSGGHGNHTSSAELSLEAFDAAADPNQFKEQLKYVSTWQTKRIFWNAYRVSGDFLTVDIGEYDVNLGKSFTEISALSRSNHKSQGFGATGTRGSRSENFRFVDGTPAAEDVMDGVNTSWSRIPGGEKVGTILKRVENSLDVNNPAASIPDLLEAYKELDKLGENVWVSVKKKELKKVIVSAAGLWIEAISGDYSTTPGDKINIKTTLVNRSNQNIAIVKVGFPELNFTENINNQLSNNRPVSFEKSISIPEKIETSQPYWLRENSDFGAFNISDQRLIGIAENKASVNAKVFLSFDGYEIPFDVPVLYRWRDRVRGELYRSLEIRPVIMVNLEDKVKIFADGNAQEISVKVKSGAAKVNGSLSLVGNSGWKVSPAVVPFSLANKYDEAIVTFSVTPPNSTSEASFSAVASVSEGKYDRSLVEIDYPHIPNQVLFPKTTIKFVRLNIETLGHKVGYINGSGDDVPASLRNLGYEVTMLSDNMLESDDLLQYDAIVTGVRAYNTRTRMKHIQPKLMEYVKNGGTFVVQYNTSRGIPVAQIGPYPMQLSSDRISVEDAELNFLLPNHKLLNYPNKITQDDLKNWVQERGLYFAGSWSKEYDALFSGHDPNETDKKGSTLYAEYGKGVFIYSGISFFRQLPAGIPGAYKLFVNLISAGGNNDK